MRNTLLVLLLVQSVISAQAVNNDGDIDTTFRRPVIEALRTSEAIKIDGILTESIWQRTGISEFTQRDPVEGVSPSEKTEVWIAYDDAAIYFAARMYDRNPDSITARIVRRDMDTPSDWFYVAIDSYHDRRSGFYFAVNPAGSIQDGTFANDEETDNTWDGVWEVATTVDNQGWTAEFRIPYSQLRFPVQEEYTWGVNFLRGIDRRKEESYFVMVPKKESGFVSRFADLIGIRDIKPPTKLEILPYAVSSSKITNQYEGGDPFDNGTSFNGNLGADIKYGLGSNLTLNATFNPDFGQVEVDPAVVNLSQFETFFDEKRPFFIEGSNFFEFGRGGVNSNWGFNWGNPSFFYSRRIGRPPRGDVQHDGFSDVPDRTTIIGAAKLTGKISKGWSVGTLSALTAREYGHVDSSGIRFEDEVEPLTSYNVVRSLGEFNDGKQGLGFLGTAVLRDLHQPYLVDVFNRRSYAFGIDGWTNIDADREYVVSGWYAASRIEGSKNRINDVQQSALHYFQRPDADHVEVEPSATSLSGNAGRVAINKQKGNMRLNTAVGWITPGFTSNDLGFLFRTDVINAHIVWGYQWFEPDGTFRRKGFNVATFRNYDFGGNKIGEGYFLFYHTQLMNYWGFGGNLNYSPAVLDNSKTRGGPLMMTTDGMNAFMWAETDYRETLVYNIEFGGGTYKSGSYFRFISPGISWKPSAGFSLRFSPSYNRDHTLAQYIDQRNDPTATSTYHSRYVFATIDQKEFSGNIRIDWTFTPKLSLQAFIQPLISVGAYSDFKEFKEPRTFSFIHYGYDNNSTIVQNTDGNYDIDPDGNGSVQPFTIDNPDFNFKSLRGNVILRWEYLPGSTAFFVWTRSQTNFDDAGDFNFGRDTGKLLGAADNENVFLLKVAYWIHP